MMFIDELYQKSLADNEKNLTFWEDYLHSMKSLHFDVYAKKLKVPILVPVGNRILFRGELIHTNEVTVSLGCDYFVKCSIAQAEVLKERRIKDAQSKVDLYRQEKEYLENRIAFTKENVYEENVQEVLEVYTEEEDKAWREKHKENVKKYKQGIAKQDTKPKDEVSDAELWERLEELELQEELENELLDNYNEIIDKRKENTFLINEESLLRNSLKEEDNKRKSNEVINHEVTNQLESNVENSEKLIENKKDVHIENISKEISKHDLLQKVLDKQNELENKLLELKHRERAQSRTEQDLISRLDEMEKLDELEDEMERLDDILETEDVEKEEDVIESDEDTNTSDSTKLKKSISFADHNDSKTLEITFKHSGTEPNNKPFSPEKGILKPSDLYEAYSKLFDNKTTSILKKSKYGPEVTEDMEKDLKQTKQVMFEESVETESLEPQDKTIVIKDVVENIGVNQHKIEGGSRPTSLFKKKRMQNKF